jgi:hypothetical protein
VADGGYAQQAAGAPAPGVRAPGQGAPAGAAGRSADAGVTSAMRAITVGQDGAQESPAPKAAQKPAKPASAAAEAMAAMAAAAALLDSLGPTVTAAPSADVAGGPAAARTIDREAATPAAGAPTAGAVDDLVVPEIDPALAYGPDDPGYGPPGPDWYKRGEQLGGEQQRTAAAPAGGKPAGPGAEERDGHSVRGPFEPLRTSESGAEYLPGEAPGAGAPGDPDRDEPAYEPRGAEPQGAGEPERLNFGTAEELEGPDAGTLGEIRNLYRIADTAEGEGMFDDLLERQRQLISDFFKDSRGEAGSGEGQDPPGFDGAQSLAGLGGDLRGTVAGERLLALMPQPSLAGRRSRSCPRRGAGCLGPPASG